MQVEQVGRGQMLSAEAYPARYTVCFLSIHVTVQDQTCIHGDYYLSSSLCSMVEQGVPGQGWSLPIAAFATFQPDVTRFTVPFRNRCTYLDYSPRSHAYAVPSPIAVF